MTLSLWLFGREILSVVLTPGLSVDATEVEEEPAYPAFQTHSLCETAPEFGFAGWGYYLPEDPGFTPNA